VQNPFVAKLCAGIDLRDDDRRALEAASARTRTIGPREQIIGEGDRPNDVHLIIEGFAARAKTLPGGDRQIMALLLPGDSCDLHVAILGEMDHDIVAITKCTLVDIPRHVIEELLGSPTLARALWWSTLVDEAVLREWLVSMGRRPADEQAAHLFCELYIRLATVGRADEDSYDLPLTQEELGDVLGLSIVHVNRVLQKLKADGLVERRGSRVRLLDRTRLAEFAAFNPNYLHLRGTNAGPA
jgi:CRP-like cAMP-binding protein